MDRTTGLKLLGLGVSATAEQVEVAFRSRLSELQRQSSGGAAGDPAREQLQQSARALREAYAAACGGGGGGGVTPASRGTSAGAAPPASVPSSSAPLSQTMLRDLPGVRPQYTQDYGRQEPGAGSRLTLGEGQVLAGRYEVRRKLGAGGMGAVFAALDRNRDQEIAVKVLLPGLLRDPVARERFMEEAKLSADLSHPQIVNVYDVQRDGELHFITMELLDGRTLREETELRKQLKRPFEVAEVRRFASQLCEALGYAHQTTVHRDVKPENVWLLADDDRVKLMDFGIARLLNTSQLTMTGTSMGTAYYMAPEQLKGSKNVDGRADQYAVAAVLYEMLTGEVPAGAVSAPRALRKGVPAGLSAALMKALSPKAQDRYPDMATFAAALMRGRGVGGGIRPKGLAIAAAVVLVAAGAAATYPRWGGPARSLIAGLTRDEAGKHAAEQARDAARQGAEQWQRSTADEQFKAFRSTAAAAAAAALAEGEQLYAQKKDDEAKAAFERGRNQYAAAVTDLAERQQSRAAADKVGEKARQAAERWQQATAVAKFGRYHLLPTAERSLASGQQLYNEFRGSEAKSDFGEALRQYEAALDALEGLERVKDLQGKWEAASKAANLPRSARIQNADVAQIAADAALTKGDIVGAKNAIALAESAYGQANSELEELCIERQVQVRSSRKLLDAEQAKLSAAVQATKNEVAVHERDPDLTKQGSERQQALQRLEDARARSAVRAKIQEMCERDVAAQQSLAQLDAALETSDRLMTGRKYFEALVKMVETQIASQRLLTLQKAIEVTVDRTASLCATQQRLARMYETYKQSPSSKLALAGEALAKADAAITAADYANASAKCDEAATAHALLERVVPDRYKTVQAAMDAAEAGDVVRVKPGLYEGSIRFKDGVILVGDGADVTTLRASGQCISFEDCHSAVMADVAIDQLGWNSVFAEWRNVLIGDKKAEDLAVATAKTAPTGGYALQYQPTDYDGVKATRMTLTIIVKREAVRIVRSNVALWGCRVARAAGAGIHVDGKSRFRMQGGHVLANEDDGILADIGASIAINHVTTTGNGKNGIVTSLSEDATIIGVTAQDNKDAGISINAFTMGPTCKPSKALIDGTHCKGNMSSGISMYSNRDDLTISNSECDGNGGPGIKIGGQGATATITNCTCANNAEDGILLFASIVGALRSNKVYANKKHGIDFYEATGAAEGNICSSNTWSGIVAGNTGATPVLRRNRCDDNGNWGILFIDGASPTIAADNTGSGNGHGQVMQGTPRE